MKKNMNLAQLSELSEEEARGKMIVNPEWLKPKEKPYFHQISMNCFREISRLHRKVLI